MNYETLVQKIKNFEGSITTQIQEIEDDLLTTDPDYAQERFKQIQSETYQEILERYEEVFEEILVDTEIM